MNRFRLIAVLLFSLLASFALRADSLSDLARDQFEKGPSALSPVSRSPFSPGSVSDSEIDLSSLSIQGIIWGPEAKMVLLSGRVVKQGEKIGKYLVKQVEVNRVLLSYGESVYPLKLANYVEPENWGNGYYVEFQNAGLRDALRLLSKAADLNLITPQGLTGQVTVSLQDIELMQAIRSILRVNGYEYAIESDIIRIGRPEEFAGGTDLATQVFRLKYATAKDLVPVVKPLLSDRGQVISDDRSNTLTVKDRDPVVNNIRALLETIDRKDQQVQIEARIVDATRDFSRSLGIRWGAGGRGGGVTVSGTQAAGTNQDTENPLNVNLGAENATSGVGILIGQISDAVNIEAQLTAAEQKGSVQILSRPSVTTLNNVPAKIRSGTKIYVKSTSSISIGATGGTGTGDTAALQEIDTGIELTVTPQISMDEFIKLKIDASQSEADFSRTVDGIPAVIDSTASTTVLLENGTTTVIGGLYRVKESKQQRGVPGLQNIPVMGYLFKSKTRSKTDTELMIFITPKIVKY